MRKQLLLLMALGAGCSRGETVSQADQAVALAAAVADPWELTYAPALQVEIDAMTRTAAGYLYQDLVPGTGDSLAAGQSASVRYTGWLPDGSEFDSNRDGPPFAFQVGAGNVIPGWDQGLIGMRVGGKRKLILPPSLGYGEMGAGPIPPNATLVFDVELLAIAP